MWSNKNGFALAAAVFVYTSNYSPTLQSFVLKYLHEIRVGFIAAGG